MWFEEISFGGFPGNLKGVGRTAAAETDRKTISPPVTLDDLINKSFQLRKPSHLEIYKTFIKQYM